MRNVLLDTGVLVALLDKSERNHESCVVFFKDFRGNILTTEPVLTEALYLLSHSTKAQRVCIEFILKGGTSLIPQSAESLARAAALMGKYKDIPMDFADATLVALAEEMNVPDILTLDKRGFNAYRIRGKTPFIILP
ncbi:MAG: PIN domain-containing protein [Nitrospiraceae bacterium]|nr:PIN domain-containing protein [Nitrospiraceae bacterium]